MTLFDQPSGQPEPEHPLTDEQVGYHRQMLRTRTNDPDSGVCPVCGVRSCPHFRDAYDRLAAAGMDMGERRQWDREDKA
jgi:hypothetical protein